MSLDICAVGELISPKFIISIPKLIIYKMIYDFFAQFDEFYLHIQADVRHSVCTFKKHISKNYHDISPLMPFIAVGDGE